MKMNKEEGQLIIQNIDKILGKSVQKEELEELEETQSLNEGLALGVGPFLRGHRVINELLLLAMTIFPNDSIFYKLTAGMQKPLGTFVDTMDEFWSNNKILFGLLFTSMLAADVFGTSAVVAKEKFLQILRKNIAKAYGLNTFDPPEMPKIDTSSPPRPPKKQPSALQEEFKRMQDLAGLNKKDL